MQSMLNKQGGGENVSQEGSQAQANFPGAAGAGTGAAREVDAENKGQAAD